jgi:hypothetical protein
MQLFISSIIVSMLLAGCDQQMADRAGDALREVTQTIQRNLNKEHREAIQRVNTAVIEIFETHGVKGKRPSAAEVRTMYRNFYADLAAINVSECPEDYRAQYRRVVVRARELSEAANSVPSDFAELLGYWFTQANNPNPDVFGQAASRNLKIAMEKMKFELSELDALAKKYH